MVMEYAIIAFAVILAVYVVTKYFDTKGKSDAPPAVTPGTKPEEPQTPPNVNPIEPLKDGDKVTIVKDGTHSRGTVKKMPQGLQVFDENGKIVLDLTTRLCKYLGEAETGFADGSLIHEGLSEGDFWIFDLEREFDLKNHNVSQGIQIPTFTRSGNQLSWHFNGNGSEMRVNRHFIYGIY